MIVKAEVHKDGEVYKFSLNINESLPVEEQRKLWDKMWQNGRAQFIPITQVT